MSAFSTALVYRREGAPDVFVERIIECDGRREPSHIAVCDRLQETYSFHQDVLNDLDRRSETDATGRFGQRAQKVEQDIEVGR